MVEYQNDEKNPSSSFPTTMDGPTVSAVSTTMIVKEQYHLRQQQHHSNTGIQAHNHHHPIMKENDDLEKIVAATIQTLHCVLDRIIQEEIIDPMAPILNQYHLQQLRYNNNNISNYSNEMMPPSQPTIPNSDANQAHAFLVRRISVSFR
jgi:hypothetical protein